MRNNGGVGLGNYDGVDTLNGFARMSSAPGYEVGAPASVIDDYVSSVATDWGTGSAYFVASPGLAHDTELRAWIARSERNTFGRAAAVRAWRSWLAADVRHVVPTVNARALVMFGLHHATAPAGRWLGEALPHGEVFGYPNQNFDWWYLEGQDAAVSAIEEFVTGTRSQAPPDRILATVLFTDVVDSTARALRLGDHRWREVLDRHDRMAAEVVTAHRGRLVKQTGDGILATFDGPARGVECARRLVAEMARDEIPIRAGLHTGEVEMRGNDVAGAAVHIASRVAAQAGAGEVLVSRTIPDLVVGSALCFTEHGTHELKGLPGSWELYAVGMDDLHE